MVHLLGGRAVIQRVASAVRGLARGEEQCTYHGRGV